MKVVIPLAGFGTRLRPHTWSRPKPLVSVAGKPVLGHVLDDLLPLEPEEVIFITGWLGDQIETYVRAAYPDLNTRYVEQTELKGQSHALSLARGIKGDLLIVFVDTLVQADLGQLRDLDGDGAIFVKEVEDPRRFGVVALDAAGYITRLVEKPATMENRLAVIGLYFVRRAEDLFAAIDEQMAGNMQTKGEFYLADAFNLMIDHGARLRAPSVDVWEDCGTTETLLETNRSRLDRLRPAVEDRPSVAIIPPVLIHPSATIERAVLGPHVAIGAGAVVRDSIVRDAIVDDGATLEQALVEHSVIGPRARLTGRFRRANLGETSADDAGDGTW